MVQIAPLRARYNWFYGYVIDNLFLVCVFPYAWRVRFPNESTLMRLDNGEQERERRRAFSETMGSPEGN